MIAGLAMAVQHLWVVYNMVEMLAHSPHNRSWSWVVSDLETFFLRVSAPAFLLLLAASGITLPVSRKQQYLAMALAITQGASIVYYFPRMWNRNIHRDWQNIERARIFVHEMGWLEWFRIPEIYGLTSDALNLLRDIALLLFLVAPRH